MDSVSIDKVFETPLFSNLCREFRSDGSVTFHRDQHFLLSDLYANSSLNAQKIKAGNADLSLPDDVLFEKLSSRYLSSSADAYQYHKKLRQEMQYENNYRQLVNSLQDSSDKDDKVHSDEKSE